MSSTILDKPLAVTRAPAGFRPDIEGLRAVAIGLVLIYHAGFPWITGGFVGVDVFFVISGFLITGLLLREIDRTGRVSLPAFYARRAKRLLPATAVVLVATSILTYLFLPVTQRAVFGGDILSAAAYVANWRFADRAVDYLAEGIDLSPVQHFWSLAVEEQFYVLWPLLIVVCVWLARRAGWNVRRPLVIALALVAVPSFISSIMMTSSNPAAAFFVTPTRLWEMAIGAAAALAASQFHRIPAFVGAVIATLGVAAILMSALVFDGTTAWPGHLALVPALGTAAAIVGGHVAGRRGVGALLSSPLFVWVGGLSYSLYLWHWPLLIAATAYWDGNLGVKRGLLVVGLSFIPAWLCHVLVENPIRFGRRMRSTGFALSVGANFTLVGIIAGLVLMTMVPAPVAAPPASAAPGAQVVLTDPAAAAELWMVDTSPIITPAPGLATQDNPVAYADGCQQNQRDSNVVTCEYGDTSSQTVVVVAGDSKSLQWQPVLDQIGKENGWKLVTMTKSACAFTDAVVLDGKDVIYDSCTAWNTEAVAMILGLRPAVVLTSQGAARALTDPTNIDAGLSQQTMLAGLVSRWTTLTDAGIPVVAIENNPNPDGQVYECVASNLDKLSACAFPDSEAGSAQVQRAAVDDVPGARLLPMTDVVCPDGMCPAVMGNVLVYRQGSHLTKTFIESTREIFEPRLTEILTDAAPSVDW